MKKISSFFLIIIFCLMLIGCKKNEIIEDDKEFINLYYEYYAGYESDFVGIDLRDYDNAYVLGHFKGFVSFEYFTKNNKSDEVKEKFTKWIELNYNKKTTIFLIDDGSNIVPKVMEILTELKYKTVYGSINGYSNLLKANNNVIDIVIGGEGCDC